MSLSLISSSTQSPPLSPRIKRSASDADIPQSRQQQIIYPAYAIVPRLAYSTHDVTPHSYAFINERTVVFPVGRHVFKYDIGSGSSGSGATSSLPVNPPNAQSATGAQSSTAPSLSSEDGDDRGVSNCMELMLQRSHSTEAWCCVSPDSQRLALIEMNNNITSSNNNNHHHTHGQDRHSHHGGDGQHASSSTLHNTSSVSSSSRAVISIIDLSQPTFPVIWQFNHSHVGRVQSVSWSSSSTLLAVNVDWCEDDDERQRLKAEREQQQKDREERETLHQHHPHSHNDNNSSRPATTSNAQHHRKGSKWGSLKSTFKNDGRPGTASSTSSNEHDHTQTTNNNNKSSNNGKATRSRGAVTAWRIDTKKLVAIHETEHHIRCVAIHPDDPALLVAVGVRYLRHLRIVGGHMDEVTVMRRLLERSYLLHGCVWLGKDVIASIGQNNEIMIMKSGSVKQSIQPAPTVNNTQSATASLLSPSSIALSGMLNTDQLLCIQSYRDGFLVGTAEGWLHHYVPNTSPTKLNQHQMYVSATSYHHPRGAIVSFVCNPTETVIMCAIQNHGLCSLNIPAATTDFPTTNINNTLMEQPTFVNHLSPLPAITGIASCDSRGVTALIHSDHSLSIFTHLPTSSTPSVPSIHHTFAECPLAVALHRDGYKLLVGFETQIAFLYLLRNTVKLSFSIQLPTPTVSPLCIQYSHGHDRIGIATGIHVFLYDAYTLLLLQHLPCMTSGITSIAWNDDDSLLAISTIEGGIFVYNTLTQTKVLDYVEKGVEYRSMLVDWGRNWVEYTAKVLLSKDPHSIQAEHYDSHTLIAMGVSHGMGAKLRAFTTQHTLGKDLQLIYPHDDGYRFKHTLYTTMAVDRIKRLLFLGTNTGYLCVFTYPVSVVKRSSGNSSSSSSSPGSSSGSTEQYQVTMLFCSQLHDHVPIVYMNYLPSYQTLITVGSDGHLISTDLRIANPHYIGAHTHIHTHSPATAHSQNLLHLHSSPSNRNASINVMTSPTITTTTTTSTVTSINPHSPYLPRILPLTANLRTSNLHPFPAAYHCDPDLIFLKNTDYYHLMTTIKNSELSMKKIERTAEYQLTAQKEYYVHHLKLLRSEMESILTTKNHEIVEWNKKMKKMEIERDHMMHMFEQDKMTMEQRMKNHAEKRLYEHTVLYEQKCNEFNKLTQLYEQCEQEHKIHLYELQTKLQLQLSTQQSTALQRINELENKVIHTEKLYEEAMLQLEREYDQELILVQKETTTSLSKHRENTAILVAEMSAAKRKLDEKQSVLSNLELVVSEQDDNLHHTSSVIKKLTQQLSSQEKILRYKEEDITRRQYELAGARQDNTVLKNFIEILEHRIAELENREAPALDALMAMKNKIERMNQELFVLSTNNQKAAEEVSRKKGESERLFTSVTTLRHKLAKREQWMECVKKEMKYLVEHSGNGSANERLHTDLRKLFVALFESHSEGSNISSSSSSGSSNSNTSSTDELEEIRMQNRVAAEIDRQRRYLEKSIAGLKQQQVSLNQRRKTETESALQQNINFLYEVNRLREENKELQNKVLNLRNEIQRKNSISNTSTSTGTTAAIAQAGRVKDEQEKKNKKPGVGAAKQVEGKNAASEAGKLSEEEKEEETTANSNPPAPLSPTDQHASSGGGVLLRGTTRTLYELSLHHHDHQQLLHQLDEAYATIEQQRTGMTSLQRGVEQAIEIAQQRYYEAEAAKRRIKELQGNHHQLLHTHNAYTKEEHKTAGDLVVTVTAPDINASATSSSTAPMAAGSLSLKSPFKHAKSVKSPASGFTLPSLAGPGSLPSLYQNGPPSNSIEAKIAALNTNS